MNNKTASVISEEKIIEKILIFRDEKVIIDVHLAAIYGVENRALKQAVRRNLDLFPLDFMFILNEQEVEIMVSQNVIPSKQYLGGSYPYAFTEAGVAMLSSVLKSKRAKEMNVAIVRAFVRLRKILFNHTELRLEIELIKNKLINHGKNIDLIFEYLDELADKEEKPGQRIMIGYKTEEKK